MNTAPATTPLGQPIVYAFPRKRHSHRCTRCGGRPVACYKQGCQKSPVVATCQWCRR